MFTHKFNEKIFSLTEMSYDIDPSTHYFSPNEEYYLTYPEKHDFLIKPDKEVVYSLNNFAHRSEDFVPIDKNKTNILFAGCSSTFGEGIPENTRWSNIVHSQFENVGPLQVLGYPGAGADRLISNIFKYFNVFGNPDYVFIMFADFSRHIQFSTDPENEIFKNVLMYDYETSEISNNKNLESLLFQFQNYYRLLEVYCNSHGIKLYASTWDGLTQEQAQKIGFRSFEPINFNNVADHFLKIDKESLRGLNKKTYFRARDGHHPGTIVNSFVANHFMERLKNDKKD